MPNVLTQIEPTPVQIRSGDTVTLAISYESMQLGTVELRAAAPFELKPTSVVLAPDRDGRRQVPVTIHRRDLHGGPLRCHVITTFFDSSLHFFIEVR